MLSKRIKNILATFAECRYFTYHRQRQSVRHNLFQVCLFFFWEPKYWEQNTVVIIYCNLPVSPVSWSDLSWGLGEGNKKVSWLKKKLNTVPGSKKPPANLSLNIWVLSLNVAQGWDEVTGLMFSAYLQTPELDRGREIPIYYHLWYGLILSTTQLGLLLPCMFLLMQWRWALNLKLLFWRTSCIMAWELL